MGTLRFTYDQRAELVYAQMMDPDQVRARSAAFGEREIRVLRSGDQLTHTRVVDLQVPAFARQLFRPTNTVVDIKRWDPATRTGTFEAEVRHAPVSVRGEIAILPRGEGCEVVVSFQVKCAVPLLGAALARHVTELTEAGLRREHAWNQEQLAARS